jgi:hypothetical protein
MKRLLIWYLPQAALFCFGFWFGAVSDPPTTGMAMILFGVMLAAAYTGGLNLLLDLWARLKRKRGQPSGESLSLAGPRRSLREPPKGRERIGVRK